MKFYFLKNTYWYWHLDPKCSTDIFVVYPLWKEARSKTTEETAEQVFGFYSSNFTGNDLSKLDSRWYGTKASLYRILAFFFDHLLFSLTFSVI